MIKDILLTFLFALFRDRDQLIYFRTFDPKQVEGKVSAWKGSASINQIDNDPKFLAELIQRNAQQGIYVVVNSGGHNDADISKFNAVFVENDTLPLREQHDLLDTCPIKPSIRVITKKSVHAYWLLEGTATAPEWKTAQQRLIDYFKSDPSIRNPSRVMRLPGFNHVSMVNDAYAYLPVQADLTNEDRRYTITTILGNFPAADKTPKGRKKRSATIPQQIKEGVRNTTLTKIAGTLHHKGFSQKTVEAALIAENTERCHPPLPVEEVKRVVDSVTSYPLEEARDFDNKSGRLGPGPLNVKRLDQIKTEKIVWLWDPFIPRGEFVLLDGEEGIGKSTLVLSVAVSLGEGRGIRTVSDFEFVDIEPGKTLILSAEDSLSHVLKPRLIGLNARLDLISAIDEPFSFDAEGLQRLENAIAIHEPQLVIIDPLFSYTGKINLNNDNEIRFITRELSRIAHLHGCTIIGIRHIGKSKGLGVARAAGLNGIGWLASARSALLVGRSASTGETAIAQYKTNLSKRDERSWGYKIRSITIDGDDDQKIETSTLDWTGLSNVTLKDMLATSFDADRMEEITDAMGFVYEALFEGERAVADVNAEGKTLGLSEKQIRTARLKLGIKSGTDTIRKEGFGKDARTFIRLPLKPDHIDDEGQVCMNYAIKSNPSNTLDIVAVSGAKGQVCETEGESNLQSTTEEKDK